jgi:hypothetical protein
VDFRWTVFYGLCGSCVEQDSLEKTQGLFQILL